ncbi:MAG TPA: DUF4440 domain-containing protein [Ignavibacteriaceae bacterium]|nr:DUF4440 domain-containing protein [Ignavibacteriaceae bacterium]
MKIKMMFIVLFCIVFSAEMFSQQVDLNRARQIIEENNKKITRAMMMDDSQAMFDMYTSDAYSMSPLGPTIHGLDQIKAQHQSMQGNMPRYNQFDLKTVDVYGDGKYIIEIGTYVLDMLLPQQASPVKDNGKYVTVWEQQQDGSLKIKTEIWNSDIPTTNK